MKNSVKKRATLLAFGLFLAAAPANAAPADAAQSMWQQFLASPGHDAYITLRTSLSESKKDCASNLPGASETTQLFALVDSGNADAFASAMLVTQCLGVGDLEHFYRSSGVFAEKSPGAFLQITTAYAVSDEELPFMLTMSPPDEKEGNATAAELDKRMAALQSAQEPSIFPMQKRALLILQKARSDTPVDTGMPK
jgi:hypothetical protein